MSVAHVTLPAQTAGGATSSTLVHVAESTNDNGMNFVGAHVVSPSLVTGVATNNATINVRQLRAGAPVQTIASLTLASGTNLAALTSVAVPAAGATPVFQIGDVIDVQLVQNGTGLALPANIRAQVEIN
jgi:ABC-type tungstate transport system permease subunit